MRADPNGAQLCYEKAFRINPSDARVFYELDQLRKRIGIGPEKRLESLEQHLDLVEVRDDLSVELATLCNQTGRAEQALQVLRSRRFQPWEGGEGLTLAQHVRAHLALGREAFADYQVTRALECFEAALEAPPNLGEAKHLLANQSNIYFWLGIACSALGRVDDASNWWMRSASSIGDFQEMSVKQYSEMTFYNAMALKRLGKFSEAKSLLMELQEYADQLARETPKIDYFATSLPSMLLFEEDLLKRNELTAKFLRAQSALGLGNADEVSRLLDDILSSDPNHGPAWDLRQEMTSQPLFETSSEIRS